MLADLDLLLTAVFCTADDLLPQRKKNARRSLTDAEVATLCVAQAVMGISSDREFLAVAERRLGGLFPKLPHQPGFHKRRARLTETIEWLIGVFAADCPGHSDPVVLLDSTPVECGRYSVETVRRSELADACGYGYCRSHSRWFWGMRLHLCCAPDGTPRASILAPADQPEREVALRLLPNALRGGEQIVCDKGYAGKEFAAEVEARFAAEILRPNRKDEPGTSVPLSMIRQRIESVFWTLKDRLGRAPPRPHPERAAGANRLKALGACGGGVGQQLAGPVKPILRSVRVLSVESII
jgi:Transposase DDE domain